MYEMPMYPKLATNLQKDQVDMKLRLDCFPLGLIYHM